MPNPYEHSVKEEASTVDNSVVAKAADLPDPYANSPRKKIDPYAHSPREVKEEVIFDDSTESLESNAEKENSVIKPAEGYDDKENSSQQN